MNDHEAIPVTITILEKEYKISCPRGEHESLLISAQNVNKSMLKVREAGKALSADRVAVMAAINIAHDLVKNQKDPATNAHLENRVDQMQSLIDSIIQ